MKIEDTHFFDDYDKRLMMNMLLIFFLLGMGFISYLTVNSNPKQHRSKKKVRGEKKLLEKFLRQTGRQMHSHTPKKRKNIKNKKVKIQN